MTKRSVVLSVLALVLLVSAAWPAGEELTYSGPFVSVNSPLKLCATATDEMGNVPGVGLWFQAWTLAGIPRTNGPMSTMFTNVLGKACNNFNLNEGLYEVQAFGTDGFDGIASEPVVVSNWKTGMGPEGTSAGIASYRLGNLGPTCRAAFGLQMDFSSLFTLNVVRTPGRSGQKLVASSPGSIIQFLWIDDCNPAGPIRIEPRSYDFASLSLFPTPGMVELGLSFRGLAFAKVGNSSFLGWLEFSADTGMTPQVQPVGAPWFCGKNGTFTLKLMRFNGQVIYNVTGPFAGETCMLFPPP